MSRILTIFYANEATDILDSVEESQWPKQQREIARYVNEVQRNEFANNIKVNQ